MVDPDTLTTQQNAQSQKQGVAHALGSALLGLTHLILECDHLVEAARLLGAVEAVERATGFSGGPLEGTERQEATAALRAAHGDDAVADARRDGQQMTIDEAVAYAHEAAALIR